jgi:hypothetical protein
MSPLPGMDEHTRSNPDTDSPHSPVTEEGRQGYVISDSPEDNLRLSGNGPDGDLGVEYNNTDQAKSIVDALSAEVRING